MFMRKIAEFHIYWLIITNICRHFMDHSRLPGRPLSRSIWSYRWCGILKFNRLCFPLLPPGGHCPGTNGICHSGDGMGKDRIFSARAIWYSGCRDSPVLRRTANPL